MEVDVDLTTAGEKIAVGGAAVTALAAFLPWVSAGFLSVTGIDGDGLFTLLMAVAAAAVVLLREWEQLEQAAVGVLGVLVVLIAGATYGNLGGTSEMISMGAGIGLHLTLLGGLGMVVAAVVDRVV